MIKYLFYRFLSFWFAVSITGVPLMLHYCDMQGSASLTKCQMCLQDAEVDESDSGCCADENDGDDIVTVPVNIRADEICCHDRILVAPINFDSECQKLTEKKENDYSYSAPIIINEDHLPDRANFSAYNVSDHSPPGRCQVPINILNSTFLL